MSVLLTVLILIICIALSFIVLIQNSKGGGLASGFQSNNQIMGVRKTTDFLEKATWSLVIALFVLCISTAAFTPNTNKLNDSEPQSEIQDLVESDAVNLPGFTPEVPAE